MEIDADKIDDAALGLLWLTLLEERRAWKGLDWDALDRLHRCSAPCSRGRRHERRAGDLSKVVVTGVRCNSIASSSFSGGSMAVRSADTAPRSLTPAPTPPRSRLTESPATR
jgi:hypothetical protein